MKNYTTITQNLPIKCTPFLILITLVCCSFFSTLQAQTVTGIYTDYKGFWHSTSSNINSDYPDTDYNLLAFTVTVGSTSTTYTTDVNNTILDNNNVTYVDQTGSSPNIRDVKFRALPVTLLPTDPNGSDYYFLGFGQLTDGIDNGMDFGNNSNPFSNPITSQKLARQLTNGPKGLNLGTCLTNIPNLNAQNNLNEVRFNLSANGITQAAIGDGVPDVLFSQVAQPNNTVDQIRFVDANDNTVGNVVTINFTNDTNFPTVGMWVGDFYNLDKTDQNGVQIKREKPIKFFAKDLTAFGINTSNYQQAKTLVYVFGGSSDPAFVAYNEPSIGVASQIGIVTDPVTTNCDGTLNDITVELQDSFGDPAPQPNYPITATLASGPGSLIGDTTVTTNANGKAIFNNIEFEVGGDHKIKFTTSSLGSATTDVITTAATCNSGNAMIWTGTVSTAWSDPDNWSTSATSNVNTNNIVPNANYDVLIPNNFNGSPVLQYPILDINTGAKNIDLENNASIDLNAHLFAVAGNFGTGSSSTTGTIGGGTEYSELYMSGTSQQTIPEGMLGGDDFYKLTLDNPNDVVMNASVRMTKMLSVKQGDFTIPAQSGGNSVSNAKVVLGCNFDNGGDNAQIGPLTGDATITGDIVTEQCFPARRAFRFVSAPVNTSTSIRKNWQEDADNYSDSDPDGYGTHITGIEEVNTPGDDGLNGFDYSPSGNPSMFGFDNVNGQYNPIDNTDVTTLNAGDAYRLLIRGDRSIDITDNATAPTNTRLRTLGTVEKGPVTQTNFNATANAYNFFGNPFPAAVNMRKVLTDPQTINVNTDYYYIFDPTLNGMPVVGQPGGRGAYSVIDLNDGTSTSGSAANLYLQPMQAAFFQTAQDSDGTTTPQLHFEESYKAPNQDRTATFGNEGETSPLKKIQITLYTASALAGGETPSDGLSIKFQPWAENGYDPKDAPKFSNLDENIARNLNNGEHYLALEYRNMPEEGDSLGLFVNQYRYENYTFQVQLDGGFAHEVYLKDNYLDESTALEGGSNLYVFSIDPSIAESTAPGRFSIIFGPSTLDVPSIDKRPIVLYPNPLAGNQLTLRLGENTGKVGVTVHNMLGQQVYQAKRTADGKGEIHLDNLNLQAGVYVVKIKAQNGKQTAIKLIKK